MSETVVFLSYADEDRGKAEQILHALRVRGFPVFFARETPAGVEWEKALTATLQRAYAVVVLWSSHAAKSKWVRLEVAAGP